MKKILILAYDFPPYVSVGGLRPYSWFKFLKEYGIDPIIVTRQWTNEHGNRLDYISKSKTQTTNFEQSDLGLIIRTPYQPNYANRLLLKYGDHKYVFIRRAISAFFKYAQFFLMKGPQKALYKAAQEYLQNNNVDVIIATGEPYILFKYASLLSIQFDIPWIADYRDPWTIVNSQNKFKTANLLNWYLERKIVRHANVIITVDEIFSRKISRVIGQREIHIISNGFDPDAVSRVESIAQEGDFLSIALVGSILKWHPIQTIFSVFSEVIKENPEMKIRLNLYGLNKPHEINLLIESKFVELTNHVVIYPRIGNDELLERLAKNNVMLLFNYYGFTGTKIYDYLGIKRKIILCFSDDNESNKLKEKYYVLNEDSTQNTHVQADIIKETNSGEVVKDADHLKILLKTLYNEFIETGQIQCNTIDTDRFSRKIQTKKLAELVKKVTN
jgi:hypothetical protein